MTTSPNMMLKLARSARGLMIATGLCLPLAAFAQTQSSAPAVTAQSAASSTSTLPLDQLVTKTVHQAWIASGRNEDGFFTMIEQLAQLSSQNRGVTLPDTQEAGERFSSRMPAKIPTSSSTPSSTMPSSTLARSRPPRPEQPLLPNSFQAAQPFRQTVFLYNSPAPAPPRREQFTLADALL